jgi:hypothetical protein
MRKKVADLKYIVECPICREKRVVSYPTKLRIQSGNSQGYCETCSRLMRTKTRLNNTDDSKKTDLLKCSECGLDIRVVPSYRYSIHKQYKDNYKCIDCRLAERKLIRKTNSNKAALIKEAVSNQIELFGCVLKKEDSVFNSSRCTLGCRCKYYLECLDAVINLGWVGFSAVGIGHPKEYG